MESWGELVAAVVEFVPFLSQRKQAERDHAERTLQALSDAYYETAAYFGMLADGGEASQERQMRVAHSWDNASHMVRRYDKNLASRLSLKSRFWREGAAWTAEQRQQANIALEKVHRDGRLLLMRR